LDKEGLILVVNLKFAFVSSGRPKCRPFTDELAMARTVCDTKEMNVKLGQPLDVHAVISIFLPPLLD
jgi:hypothetical protein